jgi:hypothetical protein
MVSPLRRSQALPVANSFPGAAAGGLHTESIEKPGRLCRTPTSSVGVLFYADDWLSKRVRIVCSPT